MEPNNQNQNQNDPKTPLPPEGRPTYEDLHAEGIDIVANSGVSEANEFTMGETNSAAEMALSDMARQEAVNEAAKESAPEKTLTPEQATRISNLQEIPTRDIPVPKKPQITPEQFRQQNPFVSAQQPSETPKAPEAKNDPSIKQLRTFKSDAEEAVRYQNVSAMDIALAEQKKREAAGSRIEYIHDETSHAHLGIFIVAVLALIVALLGGWYYWFTSSQTVQVEKPVARDNIRALIPYKVGSSMVLDPEENAVGLIAERLDNVTAGTSSVYAILPKQNAETKDGATINTIFLDTDIPESLMRSFTGEYMIGAITGETNTPFVILKTSSFPIAFNGMLEWESDMVKDLLPLIKVAHGENLGTTTKAFQDSVVQNVDVRVFKNEAGTVLLAYAFPNKDTIVIATGDEALRKILAEILRVRTIQ